jgi:nonribosomal peptide synthetase DhbF
MDTLHDSDATLPLSAAQRGLWLAQKFGSPDSNFNLAESIEIHGAIDPELFISVLRQIADEADTVRVRFIENSNEGPRQIIRRSFDDDIPFIDVSGETDPRAEAERWMMAELNRPIDLVTSPLWTSALFKAAPDHFFWYHRSHHIIMDGFTGGLFARRVASFYNALVEGRAPEACPFGPLSSLLEEEEAYRG